MNEAETRAEHIDPALRAAGWGVVEGSRIHREYEITERRLEGGKARRAKALIADYVLVLSGVNYFSLSTTIIIPIPSNPDASAWARSCPFNILSQPSATATVT